MSKVRPWSFFDPEIAHKRTFPARDSCMKSAQEIADRIGYAVQVERREWNKTLDMWVDRPFVLRPKK